MEIFSKEPKTTTPSNRVNFRSRAEQESGKKVYIRSTIGDNNLLIIINEEPNNCIVKFEPHEIRKSVPFFCAVALSDIGLFAQHHTKRLIKRKRAEKRQATPVHLVGETFFFSSFNSTVSVKCYLTSHGNWRISQKYWMAKRVANGIYTIFSSSVSVVSWKTVNEINRFMWKGRSWETVEEKKIINNLNVQMFKGSSIELLYIVNNVQSQKSASFKCEARAHTETNHYIIIIWTALFFFALLLLLTSSLSFVYQIFLSICRHFVYYYLSWTMEVYMHGKYFVFPSVS